MDIIQIIVTSPKVQRVLDQKKLSSFFGWLADKKIPPPALRGIIRYFMKTNNMRLEDYDIDINKVKTFNEFFIRKFKKGARLFEDGICSPVEGYCGANGIIEKNKLYQVKGMYYSLFELIKRGIPVSMKYFITLYLSPADYHRVHAPFDCNISSIWHIPGNLNSVNAKNIQNKANIYCTNERVVLQGNSSFGNFYLIMVGAIIVGRIRLTMIEHLSPGFHRENINLFFKKGDELGLFELGSTVILVFETANAENIQLANNQKVKLGERLC